MIDTSAPLSDGWWLNRLAKRLVAKQPRIAQLQAYVDDDDLVMPIKMAPSTSAAYRRLRSMSNTNFCELIVEAARERMVPTGFRTGDSATASAGRQTDDDAWRIWQANSLDADSALVHRKALTVGESFVIVGPVDSYIGQPLISIEDPAEVEVEFAQNNRRRPIAALKVHRDALTGKLTAWLYLPGKVKRAVRVGNSDTPLSAFMATEWEWDGYELAWINAAKDVVPVVRFANKADNRSMGKGEFEAHLSTIDRINYEVLQRLEIATLQAFRQRAIKGVPATDKKGNVIDYSDIFSADPGALWLIPETAEIWESGQVDLSGIHESIKADVQYLAAVTRTPLYYLNPDANNGSAEGASLAREGLVFKVEDRIGQMTESWEAVIRLAFLMKDDAERGKLGSTQVLWAPAERFSLSERYDAAAKAQSAGVPWRYVMEDVLQFSPQDVDRMAAERAADALLAGVTGGAGGERPDAVAPNGMTFDELSKAMNSFGVAVRTGVTNESAAATTGLEGLEFTGALPVTLRPTADDAAVLES